MQKLNAIELKIMKMTLQGLAPFQVDEMTEEEQVVFSELKQDALIQWSAQHGMYFATAMGGMYVGLSRDPGT